MRNTCEGKNAPTSVCNRTWKASKAPNNIAPNSALPGRQLANITNAIHIQPLPLTIPKKNESNADIVKKAPPRAMIDEPTITAPIRNP